MREDAENLRVLRGLRAGYRAALAIAVQAGQVTLAAPQVAALNSIGRTPSTVANMLTHCGEIRLSIGPHARNHAHKTPTAPRLWVATPAVGNLRMSASCVGSKPVVN